MRIVRCLNELHVYPHGVAASLHAAFHDMRDAQLLRYLTEVSRRALVMLSRCARDYFELGDLCQASQNLVLNAVSKVSVRFFFASVFERKHRDALFRNNSAGVARATESSV